MIVHNEFGDDCMKCGKHVDPYDGIAVLLKINVLCRVCSPECIRKLSDHLLSVMGVHITPRISRERI